MNKLKPGNMIMAEAVPFGQRWTYHQGVPIDEMLEPDYFRSFSGLRIGDDIRILEMDDKNDKVLCFAEVLVMNLDPLEFFVTREKTRTVKLKPGPKPKKEVSDGEPNGNSQ